MYAFINGAYFLTQGEVSPFMLVTLLHNSLTAKLLLPLASTMIPAIESHGTHDHILLSGGSGILQLLSNGRVPFYLRGSSRPTCLTL